MVTTAKKLTYADYEKMPEDGFRHEIIDGEEFRTPAPNPDHQAVVGSVFRLLAAIGRYFCARTSEIFLPQIYHGAMNRLSPSGDSLPRNFQNFDGLEFCDAIAAVNTQEVSTTKPLVLRQYGYFITLA